MPSFANSKLNANSSVIVVGAGAHARSVLGVLVDIGCKLIGLVADGVGKSGTVQEAEIVGGLAQVTELGSRYPECKWVMAVGDNYHRLRVMREIQVRYPGAGFPPLVHPSCALAKDVRIEEGSVVMPGVVLMAGCRLGAGTLVNTSSSLDHECELREGSSTAPGVTFAGRVCLGRRSFVGIGSTIVQGVHIGDDSVVGAGSLVLESLPGNVVAYGRPARVVRQREPDSIYL